MTQSVRSKKRILSICQLQGKLAERDYLGAQKNVVKLEKSRDQLSALADQMLDVDGETRSAAVAAKMEFGHRLIALGHVQEERITRDQKTTAMLLSKAYQSKQKEERAAYDFRQAAKSSENRRQQIQPLRMNGRSNGKMASGKE